MLLTLCDQNEKNFAQALQILFKFHGQIEKSWKFIDFDEFDTDVGIKQASGYVGLKNFGCTCYMNSLLQQLYMIPELRCKVLETSFAPELTQEQLDDNLLYQLQSVFANLQESEKSYFVPRGFVNTFKFYGEPVNVRVQQDTHEFYNVLCDQVEQLIPKRDQAESAQPPDHYNFLKYTIGGTICNETKSLEPEYPYLGLKDEAFYAISLDIKNKKTLEEALDMYVKPDVLEGDNKYHCEQYDRKISAHRRSYLKDLSLMVVINLKRFEFDFNTMQRFKMNDYCEFPENINFRKWAKEGIEEEEQAHLEQAKEKEGEGEQVDDDLEEQEPMEDETEGLQMDQGLEISENDLNAEA